jgi:hypothetical protein
VSAGVIAAFLPLAAGVSGGVAALGLFVQAVAATLSRWWAGRHGDRHGHAGLLVPGLLAAAAGMTDDHADLGRGHGRPDRGPVPVRDRLRISQNVTFTLLIDRVPVSGYGTASALRNLAYDAGYGADPTRLTGPALSADGIRAQTCSRR